MTLPSSVPTLRRTSLDSADSPAGVAWQLSPLTGVPAEWSETASAPVPATVPGEVYADLLTAGLIPDPFDGDNEDRLHWIGSTDWSYRTTFTVDPALAAPGRAERHDLVFGGLDTIATVLLNGTEVGRTANQHRSYRFDVTAVLHDGANELEVRFEGPVTAAQRLSAELGDRPRAYEHPFNALRKMAAGYGWDWGPDLAGVGLWRSVGIESWSGVRLAAVRPLALVDGAPAGCRPTSSWSGPPPTGPTPRARRGTRSSSRSPWPVPPSASPSPPVSRRWWSSRRWPTWSCGGRAATARRPATT